MSSPELPGWTEKALAWGVVLFIVVPVITVSLDNNKAGIKAFGDMLAQLLLYGIIIAAVGGVVYAAVQTQKNRPQQERPVNDRVDSYGRPLKIDRTLYRFLRDRTPQTRARIHKGMAFFFTVCFGVGIGGIAFAWAGNKINVLAGIGVGLTTTLVVGAVTYMYFYYRAKDNLFPPEETEELRRQEEERKNPPIKVVIDFPRNLDPEPEPEPAPVVLRDFKEDLRERMWQRMMEFDLPIPDEKTMEIVLSVAEELYNARETTDDDEKVRACIGGMMSGFIARLPRIPLAPFKAAIVNTTYAPSLIWDLVEPMRRDGVLSTMVIRFNANMAEVTEELRARERVTPQKYPKPDVERYLDGTPLRTLLNVLVPYNPFPDKERYTHHWCMGAYGAGKTTYLRHLIRYDLERVKAGEVSLIVMDSKKLIREMRRMKLLKGVRTIIIDAETAFPLNPFHMPKDQARRVISYMLANLQGASELQGGALRFFIDAVLQSRDKTLDTLLDYVKLEDKEQPKGGIKSWSPELQQWWTKTRPKLHEATVSGLQQRLSNFVHDYPKLARMFNADSFGIDLFKELHDGGTVLLVDTDRESFGKDGANMLGRLIIALVDQLSSRRTHLQESSLKPVWFVCDEAQDYIQSDLVFADILEKARAQRIGVMVAHHHTGQLDKRIEQSLAQAGFKSDCVQPGVVNIIRRDKTMTTLTPKPYEFIDDELQMDDPEYAALRAKLKKEFPYKGPKDRSDEVEEPDDYK